MPSQVSIRRVEAHDEAGEEFANALRRSFPSIAAEITPQTVISFQGTLRGRDVVCTFEQITEEKAGRGSLFSRHYDPTTPEARERRRRLFELIDAGRSDESARAARELAESYSCVAEKP